jgi:hypothetical protein
MDEPTRTFELGDADVSVPLPADAELTELEGLEDGARHLTWAPAPGGHFMLSAGTSPGHTADGMLASEAERGSGLRVESDAPAPQVAPGARRLAYSVTRHRPRELQATGDGGVAVVPERDVRELSDLLFVPGERQSVRVGYRVEQDAPAELRAQLAGILDRVAVRRRDA